MKKNHGYSLRKGLFLLLLAGALTGCGKADEAVKKETDLTNIQQRAEEKQDLEAAAEPVQEACLDVTSVEGSVEKDFDKYTTTDEETDFGSTQQSETAKENQTDNTAVTTDIALTDDTVPTSGIKKEPDEVQTEEGKQVGTNFCSLTVECSTLLNNLDKLSEAKQKMVPADGVVYANTEVAFEEGDTAFDILQREMQNNRIQMEFNYTPVYESNYIEGIGNLYEFDCGELSGWMYCVNGTYFNYGSSQYKVQAGDSIGFHYTCDLGKDLGQGQ